MRLPNGHLRKRGNIWWVQWKHQNIPYGESLHTKNEKDARKLLDDKMTTIRASILDGTFLAKYGRSDTLPVDSGGHIRIADGWARYLKSQSRPDAVDSTLRSYVCLYNQFAQWMTDNYPTSKTLPEVTKQMARDFFSWLDDRVSPNTYNKYRNLLRLVFRVLFDEMEISCENPWACISRKKLRTNNKRCLTHEETEKILTTAKGEMLTLVLLGSHTGLRLGDCCLLEIREVDMQTRRIVHRVLKTGVIVRIPIHDELYGHLKEVLPALSAKEKYVCPEMAGLYKESSTGKTRSIVTDRFQNFFKNECGIQIYREGTGKGTGKRAVVEVGFHSLRHTFVTRAHEDNVDQATVQAIVGWGSPAMAKVYTHLSDEYLETSMSKRKRVLPVKKTEPEESAVPNTSSLASMNDEQLQEMLNNITAELSRRKQQAS